MTRHAPHLLILDEPTNHLDIEARQALIEALNEFQGAVVLITHDPHLIELVVDRLWIVADRTAAVRRRPGGLSPAAPGAAPRRTRGRQAPAGRPEGQDAANGSHGKPAKDDGLSKKERRKQAAEAREQTKQLRNQAKKLEGEIEQLGEKAARDRGQAGRPQGLQRPHRRPAGPPGRPRQGQGPARESRGTLAGTAGAAGGRGVAAHRRPASGSLARRSRQRPRVSG